MNPTITNLKNKGFRITKVRSAIISILRSAKKPISVQDIISFLYRKDLTANKTTIYRELEFLKNQNLVSEIDFGDGKKRYELDRGNHHHHIICVNCEAVSDIDFDVDLDSHEHDIAKKTGFKISQHSIEFFGLCKNCQ